MKPKLVAVRPSELVILAIHNLGEKSGSSEKDIVRFISRKYGLDADHLAPRVEAALRRGLNFGILSFKNGRYGLEEVPEPMNKDFENNMNDFKWNDGNVEKSPMDCCSRKRGRSENGNVSDIFGREIKKTRGYCYDNGPQMDERLYINGNKNTGESNPQSIAPSPQEPSVPIRQKRQSRKQRDGLKVRRRPTTQSRKSRTKRKLVRRSQKKVKAKIKSAKPKGNTQVQKKNDGGTEGGALKNLAKIFGMSGESKTTSKPKKKVKEPVNAKQRKKNASNKHCSKACPRSCPNAIRRAQMKSRENVKEEMKRNTELEIGSGAGCS